MSSEPSEDTVVRVGTPSLAVVARGISWKGAGRAVGQLTWFGSLLILAALLTPKDFGLVAVGTVVVTVTALIMEAGTGGGIIVTEGIDAAHLRGSVVRNLAAGGFFTALMIALAGPISDAFASGADPAVLRVMVLSITVAALGIVPLALLDKTLRFKARAQITVVAGVVSAVAAVAAALLGAGVWALVLRQLLNQSLLTGLSWLAARPVWPRAAKARGASRRIMRTGASWFFVIACAQFVAFSVDNLIVGRVTGVAQLGLYSLAFSLAFAPLTQIGYEIGGVLLPTMAATDEPARVRTRTLKAMRMMALFFGPWVAPAVVLAPVLVPDVLGEKWEGMVGPFQLMLAAGVAHAVVLALGETLTATGNVAYRARVDVVWATGTIGGVIVLAHLNGITGAATAHVVMWFFYAGAYGYGAWRRLDMTPSLQLRAVGGVAVTLAAQSVTTALVWAAVEGAGAPQGAAAAVAAIAGLAVAGAILATRQRPLLREAGGAISAAIRGEPA